jgi:hypothetical protein
MTESFCRICARRYSRLLLEDMDKSVVDEEQDGEGDGEREVNDNDGMGKVCRVR